MITALDLKKDYVLTGYRPWPCFYLRMHPNAAMAELYGKVTGCSKGKGSMHFLMLRPHVWRQRHCRCSDTCAAGVAFKIKYNKEDGVVLCYFGDGAITRVFFMKP